MAQADISLGSRGFGETTRRDAWWAQPALALVALSSFVVYATWAAFQGEHYHWGPYLSPFYSPLLFGEPGGWFGPKPAWWPAALPFSAALFILWAPGGFRLTCYYYRGTYYKSFWADPPSCAVGEPRKSYWGERTFPLILQNGHRFFLWVALVFLPILAHDVWKALWFADPATGEVSFGVGLGTLVLAVNTGLLGAYALGCHSLRHVVGGQFDEISRLPPCLTAYRCVSTLNRRHMTWAWLSLFSVAFADLYVRLLSMGVWSDPRLL